MPQSVVKVHGLAQLRRTMRRAGADLDELKAAHHQVAQMVARSAAAAAPRRSGRLAATVRGNNARAKATVSAGGGTVRYAGPIHWGWPRRNIRPQPFISDTAVATEPVWLRVYEKDIDRILRQVRGA